MINQWNKALEFGVDNFQTDPYEFGYVFITTVIYCIYTEDCLLCDYLQVGIRESSWVLIILSLQILHPHRIHVWYIYGNIYHQYTPVMLAYIPAPWILWDLDWKERQILGNHQLPVGSLTKAMSKRQLMEHCGYSPLAATGHDLRPTEVPQLKDEVFWVVTNGMITLW